MNTKLFVVQDEQNMKLKIFKCILQIKGTQAVKWMGYGKL